MLTGMKKSLRTTGSRLASSGVEEPVLPAGVQTRLSWARPIESYYELPPVYHDFYNSLRHDTHEFPYAVVTPTFKGFMRRENEKLICSVGDRFYILEKTKGQLNCTAYALADISYLEIGNILLNAWIRIQGIAGNGELTAVTLKFNAVSEHLFRPFLEKIRHAADYPPGIDRDAELAKFECVDALTFKFNSFARHSILPGAQVIQAVAQPEIRTPILTVFGRSFYRTVEMSHALVLTDRELIIIRDDINSPMGFDDSRYGGVWDYIPLDKIMAATLADQNDDRFALSIHLPQNDYIESLFMAPKRSEVERLLNQLEAQRSNA
jgi:hypothetical protein